MAPKQETRPCRNVAVHVRFSVQGERSDIDGKGGRWAWVKMDPQSSP